MRRTICFSKEGRAVVETQPSSPAVNQTPRQFTEGKAGLEANYVFTLKTIAGVGLVGFPNARKVHSFERAFQRKSKGRILSFHHACPHGRRD